MSMKCEEFQMLVLSDPQHDSHDLNHHKDHCKICAQFADEMGILDNHLQDALQVPVPACLKDDLCPHKISFKAKRGIRSFGYVLTSIIMFLVGVVLFVNLNGYPVSQIVLSHIEHEPFPLTTNTSPTEADIHSALTSLDIEMLHSIGKVRFVKRCMIGNTFAVHLVTQGEKGPVSVIIMPHQPLQKNEVVSSQQLQGEILPLHHGSVAIVGFKGEPLDALKERVLQNFKIL